MEDRLLASVRKIVEKVALDTADKEFERDGEFADTVVMYFLILVRFLVVVAV